MWVFFFSSRRRHTRLQGDWSSDVCSSDLYYETFNMFNAAGTTYLGAQVCAYDRTKMLAGQGATQQCFSTSTTYGGLPPADLDGPRPPPSGAPQNRESTRLKSKYPLISYALLLFEKKK